MAISKEKFLKLFLGEFRENLQGAENQIILLKNDLENTDALANLLRMLHTMKGSTRMLQFGNMEKLVHGTETVFKGVREGRYQVDSRLVRFFFIIADHLRFAADSIEKGDGDIVPDQELLLAACEKLGANESFDLASIAPLAPAAPAATIEQAPPEPKEIPADPASSQPPAPKKKHQKAPEGKADIAPQQDSRQEHLDTSIRVDSETIDHSINLVNTLTIRQLRLRTATDTFDRVEKEIVQAYRETQDIKALKRQLADICRSLRIYRSKYSDQIFEIEHGTQELRDTVIGMRMLPLSVILDRFPRMVEETASGIGKDVSVSIHGDSVRLDRTVLSKLSDPLIHIVRNAVDHGIESPELRQQAGKPARGSVRIECKTEGSRVSVMVSDDGRGLDYPAIRAKALSLWPDEEPQIRQMTNEDLVRYLFLPGFTTKEVSTTLSGRGIGLDIVKTNIEAVKGQIQLESVSGHGCTFTLLLPISASTMDGMFVLCSGKKYFIPGSAIMRTVLIDSSDCFRILQKDMFNLEGVNIPLSELAIGLQAEQLDRKTKKIPILLVRGPAEIIGIAVDRILGYDSLVYQALPRSLRANALVQGVVFDDSFNIIPILNMWVILDRLRSVRIMDTHRRFDATSQREKPTILVVDDSISTREIEVSMLELEGYNVIGAIDGVDALEKIHNRHFDIVVSDLNMPRMDGLKLLENVRRDEAFKNLPFIFVTTMDEPETRKKAESLGAQKYILKSSFEQDNLLSTVRDLLAAAGTQS
jgi:chemotaxis protein histidine kinase CheA/ActR/RegA family two-component response regulator